MNTDPVSGSAARDGERPQTVGEAMDRFFATWDEKWAAVFRDQFTQMLDVLGLDPDTVLDGPLVVLHPDEMVVKPAIIATGDTVLAPPLLIAEGQKGYVVVASGGSAKDANT